MIKTALVGCGKIAEQHLNALKLVGNASVAGLCDSDELMVRQLSERHGIKSRFTSLGEMLEKLSPQVVHITTPPSSHYRLAMECLEAGCHIYVEKPFAINEKETGDLIRYAEKKQLLLTAGFNLQFSDESLKMRDLVEKGFLGGPPIHMEVIQGYSLSDPYAKAFLSDSGHWLRSLPGGLLQNLICHGIAKISEFITDDEIEIGISGFPSPQLVETGEQEIVDELRLMISDGRNFSAYYTFSTQIGAAVNQMRLYGQKNALIVDQNHRSVIPIAGKNHKAQLNYIIPPLSIGRTYRREGWQNLKNLLNGTLRLDAGMVNLMKEFYNSVGKRGRPPIPYKQILSVSRISDQVFSHLRSQVDQD